MGFNFNTGLNGSNLIHRGMVLVLLEINFVKSISNSYRIEADTAKPFFQKHFFLNQLTHNMKKDSSLNYKFSYIKIASSEHAQNLHD